MKNIFLVPTDKPSYLFIIDMSKMFLPEAPYLSFSKFGGRTHKIEGSELYQPQFIYITSNEKPKEGDTVFYLINKAVGKVLEVGRRTFEGEEIPQVYCDGGIGSIDIKDCRKVVLSNDSSIDVQQVTDSFLTFFAENQPDYVEVKHIIKEYVDDQDAYGYDVDYYKINFTKQ